MPPQGITDFDFVLGYDNDEGHTVGSIEYDPILKDYIKRYPADWEVVKKCLGLTRSKGRHACLPAGELIYTKQQGLVDIIECEGKEVYTGQAVKGNPDRSTKGYAPNGVATLLSQGEREVWEYTLQNGKTIRCTPDHKILTMEEGWTNIQNAYENGLTLSKPLSRVPLNEDGAKRYAKSRGGELLVWGGKAAAYSKWTCSEGHIWEQWFNRMLCYEYWCKKCSNKFKFKPSKQYVTIKRSAAKCLSTYRRYDKKHSFICDLSLEDVIAAKNSQCCYCSRPATGFERISNELGHTKDNCIPACLRCNWMRGSYISHEIMLHVGEVLKKVDP
jgi:hypothetical protein